MSSYAYNFGPFTLSEADGLSRDGKPIEIGQKALSILWELAKADGRSVSKSKLLETCWPKQIVEESNLSVQIAALRKALGQTDQGLDWIVTVPRVGYRLPRNDATPEPAGEGVLRKRMIAIFPFRNLSGNSAHDYVASGLTADVTNALARYKSLTVFPTVADESPAKVRAEKLNVSHLVEGAVMISGDKLRIVVSLIDGAEGAVVWNQRFDANMADIFAVQDTIAATVAAHVEPAISEQEVEQVRRKVKPSSTVNDLYLRAQHLLNDSREDTIREAYRLLQQAMAQDPRDARLAGAMCEVFTNAYGTGLFVLTEDDRRWGEYYARLSIALSEGDGHAMSLGATALLHMSDDDMGALAAAETAYQSNPNDYQVANIAGTVHLLCGDLDVAVARYSLAISQGPADFHSRFARTGLAHALIIRGEFQKAVEVASDSLAASNGFAATYWMLIAANAHLGRMEAAKRFLGMLLERWPNSTLKLVRAGQPRFKPERVDPILEGLAKAGMPES
jgi:TolB-like protein/DNA-binding winged helix-turn-helix (wHTH) protein